MALAYLVDPENQFMTKAGTINVEGYLRVYDAATDDPAVTYCNFVGTENPEQIVLDNNGRAVVIADSERAYRLEVYNRYGTLLWTTSPLWCMSSGGGVQGSDIISTDGSISVDKTTVGSMTTFDLAIAPQSDEALEWVKTGNANIANGNVYPAYTDGTMVVFPGQGLEVFPDRLYHITCTCNVDPTGTGTSYATLSTNLMYNDGSESVTVLRRNYDVDTSVNDPVLCEFSYDFTPSAYGFVYLYIEGVAQFEHVSVELQAHRVYSGIPQLPGNIQERLIPGTGITIENNVISATAEHQVQADWAQSDSSAVDYIKNKPDLSVYATQTDLTNGLATKQDVISDLSTIRSGAALGATAVQDPNYVHTDNNYTNADAAKLSGIESGAEANVQADWTETDNSADDYIKNKPTTKHLVAGANITITDSNNNITISASTPSVQVQDVQIDGTSVVNAQGIAEIPRQVNADWNSSAGASEILNKPNLATVATSGSYTDLSNTPDLSQYATTTDLAGKVDKVTGATAGDIAVLDANGNITDTGVSSANLVHDASYVHTDENFTSAEKTKLAGIETGAEVNVQADWTESDSSSDAYILNKPTLATVATSGSYTDLSNTPSIPTATSDLTNDSGYITLSDVPAQVQSDWTETDTSAASYIQHKPTIPSTLSAGDGIDITNNVVSAKVDGSTVTINASGELQAAPAITVDQTYDSTSSNPQSGTAVADALSDYTPTSSLATVATSGSYADLSNTPTIPTATSDLQNDSGFITASDVPSNQVQSDWNESDTSDPAYIQNKPTIPVLPTMKELVAGTNIAIAEGQNTVTISATAAPQVQSDWNESDTSDPAYIQNKPDLSVYALSANLATVATSGDYTDLTNKPTIPTVPTTDQQYNPNSTNPQSGTAVAEAIAGTGQVPTVTSSDNDKVLTATYSGGVGSFAWQTPSTTQVQADWTESDTTDPSYIQNKPNLATVATSGDFNDLSNKPVIPAAQVNSDWSANSGIAQILNKPTVKPVLAGSNITITETANDFTIAASVPVIGTITV